jgi:hypothetical protein
MIFPDPVTGRPLKAYTIQGASDDGTGAYTAYIVDDRGMILEGNRLVWARQALYTNQHFCLEMEKERLGYGHSEEYIAHCASNPTLIHGS